MACRRLENVGGNRLGGFAKRIGDNRNVLG